MAKSTRKTNIKILRNNRARPASAKERSSTIS